jgi:membrane peptidoglycan carboxypeptidase
LQPTVHLQIKECTLNPQFLSRIEDKSGVIIYEPIPESHDVLNKDIAFAVIKLLEGVTEEVLDQD